MSKRLQVLVEDAELREIQRAARARRLTVAEWVRDAMRAARRSEPGKSAERKRAALAAALRHDFPTADIVQLLQEIERGYLDGPGA
jgi:hypothetical protein